MNLLKPCIVLVACCSLLTACAQVSSVLGNVSTTVTQDLPTVCDDLSIADASFATVIATGAASGHPIASSDVADEQAAMAGVSAICANPAAFTSVASALQTALAAYSKVALALAAAQNGAAQ